MTAPLFSDREDEGALYKPHIEACFMYYHRSAKYLSLHSPFHLQASLKLRDLNSLFEIQNLGFSSYISIVRVDVKVGI